MFKTQPIKVKEVVKYIKPIVVELTQTYGKTSHPDFDIQLREKTGIGWKQVKNYRNNPNQNSTIAANSKVAKFVREQRRIDLSFKLKTVLVNILSVFFLVAILFSIFYTFKTSQESELNRLIEKKLHQRKKSELFYDCKIKKGENITCPEGEYRFIK